jgi:hypothetical protein
MSNDPSADDILTRFAVWREQRLPAIVTAAKTDPRYQNLLWISEQWQQLWSGPEGMLKTQHALRQQVHNPGWHRVLVARYDILEKGLLDAAQRFVDELHKLELRPVAEMACAGVDDSDGGHLD